MNNKIVVSKKLNNILCQIYNIDFLFVDELLTQDADFYTVAHKQNPCLEDHVRAGIKLSELASRFNRPIYEVECYPGNFSVYFVGDYDEVKEILQKALNKAKKTLKKEK